MFLFFPILSAHLYFYYSPFLFSPLEFVTFAGLASKAFCGIKKNIHWKQYSTGEKMFIKDMQRIKGLMPFFVCVIFFCTFFLRLIFLIYVIIARKYMQKVTVKFPCCAIEQGRGIF